MKSFKIYLKEGNENTYLSLAQDPKSNQRILQKMLDEKVREVGFSTRKYYRGMSSSDPSIIDSRKGKYNTAIAGFFTSSPNGADGYARKYSDGVVKLFFLNVDEESVFNEADIESIREEIESEGMNVEDLEGDVTTDNIEFVELLKGMGYNAIRTEGNFPYDEVAVFSPSQIKSADPVTYDDQGNIIPLEKRFDSGNNDIRY